MKLRLLFLAFLGLSAIFFASIITPEVAYARECTGDECNGLGCNQGCGDGYKCKYDSGCGDYYCAEDFSCGGAGNPDTCGTCNQNCFCSGVDNNKYCYDSCGNYCQVGTNCGGGGDTVSPPPPPPNCGTCQNKTNAGCCDVNVPYQEGTCSNTGETCGSCGNTNTSVCKGGGSGGGTVSTQYYNCVAAACPSCAQKGNIDWNCVSNTISCSSGVAACGTECYSEDNASPSQVNNVSGNSIWDIKYVFDTKGGKNYSKFINDFVCNSGSSCSLSVMYWVWTGTKWEQHGTPGWNFGNCSTQKTWTTGDDFTELNKFSSKIGIAIGSVSSGCNINIKNPRFRNVTACTGNISGTVYSNSSCNLSGSGVPWTKIYSTDNKINLFTDQDGKYKAGNVNNKSYTLYVTPPPDYLVCSGTSPKTVTVAGNNVTADFAVKPNISYLEGNFFADSNKNGVFGKGADALKKDGIIKIEKNNGKGDRSVTSTAGPANNFSFGNIANGNYKLKSLTGIPSGYVLMPCSEIVTSGNKPEGRYLYCNNGASKPYDLRVWKNNNLSDVKNDLIDLNNTLASVDFPLKNNTIPTPTLTHTPTPTVTIGPSAWRQVIGGDTYQPKVSPPSIPSPYPDPPGKFYLQELSGSNPKSDGVILAQASGVSPDITINPSDKDSRRRFKAYVPSLITNVTLPTYSEYENMLLKKDYQDCDTKDPVSAPSGCTGTGSNIFYYHGKSSEHTIALSTFSGTAKVYLINGDLKINGNISAFGTGTAVAFIVSGKITVTGNVSSINGVYISYGDFIIEDHPTNPFTLWGSLFANKLTETRTYKNASNPTFKYAFNPNYLIPLTQILGKSGVNWQEVAP